MYLDSHSGTALNCNEWENFISTIVYTILLILLNCCILLKYVLSQIARCDCGISPIDRIDRSMVVIMTISIILSRIHRINEILAALEGYR